MAAEKLVAETVESEDADALSALVTTVADAGGHLGGGFLGEGDGEDVFAVEVGDGVEQVGDALDNYAGLAGAGAGDDQHGAVQVFDGSALGGVEVDGCFGCGHSVVRVILARREDKSLRRVARGSA